jgi:hypothetical protein
LNLIGSDGEILSNSDITETSIGQSINDAYLEEVFPELQNQYPHFYEKVALIPNYTTTGTVASGSTGTTLVATESIFSESMVGQNVYNTTDSELTKISAYTSATTVTVKATIDDSWDGDSIKVLDRDVILTTEADDEISVKYVYVRYKAADKYIKARPRLENDIFQTGQETFSKGSPIYLATTIETADSLLDAVSIYPTFDEPDDSAVKIKYVELPDIMVANGDTPRLPLGNHEFLSWNAVHEGALARGDYALADRAKRNLEEGKNALLSTYRPTSMDEVLKIGLPRRLEYIRNRLI